MRRKRLVIVICRALDAYGFADFKWCTKRMRALTSVYAWDDPKRMKFGTPTEVIIFTYIDCLLLFVN